MINLSDEMITQIDSLILRFAQMQDNIGKQIFPKILTLLEEDSNNLSFLDKLNKLEKLELLPSANFWKKLRETRNFISHEYPEDYEMIAEQLNTCVVQAEKLIIYWHDLRIKINKMIK